MKDRRIIKIVFIIFILIFIFYIVFSSHFLKGKNHNIESNQKRAKFEKLENKSKDLLKKDSLEKLYIKNMSVLKKQSLSSEFFRLEKIFSPTAIGKYFAISTVMLQLRDDPDPDLSNGFDSLINELKLNPEESFLELTKALEKWPKDLNSEKRLWYQWLKNLDVEDEKKTTFLLSQITAFSLDHSKFRSQSLLSCSMALEMLIELNKDFPAQLEGYLEKIIDIHKDQPQILDTLFITYSFYDEKSAKSLFEGYL